MGRAGALKSLQQLGTNQKVSRDTIHIYYLPRHREVKSLELSHSRTFVSVESWRAPRLPTVPYMLTLMLTLVFSTPARIYRTV
jgi:hypothetical protein